MNISIDTSALGSFVGIIAIAAVAAVLLALIVRKVRRFAASREFEGFDRDTMRRRWQEIEALLDAPGEMPRKLAIIEADKLLDYALKSLAMPGETLGERLKYAAYKYPQIRDVWWAHKIRNQLAHEATYHLDSGVAKSALRQFRATLQMLGAI